MSSPQTPTSPSSSKKSGFLRTFFIVIALILFGILIGVLAARFLPMPATTVIPTPTPTITIEPTETLTPTPIVDLTANWKTYNDIIEKLSFKYPNQYTIEKRPFDDGSAMSYLFAKDYLVTLDVFSKYTPNQVEFFYDSPSTGKLDIGGNIWDTYYLPTGYGDGAVGSGQPIFGLQTEFNKHLLRVTLFNQKTITEEQKQILSTFNFSGSVTTPTPTISMIPSGWTKREFPTVKLVLYAPSDWKSGIQSYPEIPSNLILFWQGATSDTSTVQLNIKNNWDNMSGQYEARNFQINDSLYATKVDPPKKNEQVLDRYQTNYVFEKDGKVYSLDCVHNWIDTNYKMCETLLKTIEFIK